MSELNNFTVVINLSNFFSDYRHRARIFINNNIQTIQALQDRVSHIFRIKNFHLTSQNEFLPPSEDIRILRNNEVLWATPTNPDQILEESQLEVETKDHHEPMIDLNSSDYVPLSDKPKKRKKSAPGVDENLIEDPDAEPVKKKKMKKSKKKNKRSVEECNGLNTSNITLMTGIEEIESSSKPDDHEKTSPAISFGGSSSNASLSYKKNKTVPLITDQYLKQKKVNIVKIDFVAGSPASLRELELKEVQKQANECLDVHPEIQQNQYEIPAKSVEEQSVRNAEDIADYSKEITFPSESKLKVDVGNSNQNYCDKVSEPVAFAGLEKKPPKTLPKPKFFKTPNWRKQVSSLNVSTSFKEIPVVQKITATASIESENSDKQVPENKTEAAAKEISDTGNANPAMKLEPEPEQSSKISQATGASPVNSSYMTMSSATEEEILQTSFEISGIPSNGSDAVRSEMGETENGSLEMSGVHRIHTGGGSKPFKQISGVGSLLEGLRASTSTTSLDTACEPDTSEFVTRRVRKRSRKRQKKSRDSTDYTDHVRETYQPRPMNVKGSPAIHIKFGEEEALDDASEVAANAEVGECISLNGSKTILVESENEEVNVKEKDILNSPLMTHLLPRAGDLIAFKVLKLSEDYLPVVSSYITAKVLNFDSGRKLVHFEIIGGLDQCQDPEGKFSMDLISNEETKSRNRMFFWADLIEPRLIYP